MLYHLFYPLRSLFSPFNVFQYITFRAAGGLLTALFIFFLIAPYIIRKLKTHQIIQPLREDGPKTHLTKAGTPTMGGIIILLSILTSFLLWARWDNRFTWLIFFSASFLGLIGYFDDYSKLVKKNSSGLSARSKLFYELLLAFLVASYLYLNPPNAGYTTRVSIPYLKDFSVNLGSLYLIFVILVIVSSANAVNLTDGLDGLAIGLLIIAAMTYAIFAYLSGHAKFADYLRLIPIRGGGELAIFLTALVGAGLGFLWYNSYPAEVFMGDMGALFLGGTIGIVGVCIKQELLLLLVGGVFLAEIVSVVLQIYFFQTYGKRIFKMAPLHHHFELKGWAEPKVTIRFWIIGIILALIALTSLKIR